MEDQNTIEDFLVELKKKFKRELPRIKKEIKVYEEKLSSGKLEKNPSPSPQFN